MDMKKYAQILLVFVSIVVYRGQYVFAVPEGGSTDNTGQVRLDPAVVDTYQKAMVDPLGGVALGTMKSQTDSSLKDTSSQDSAPTVAEQKQIDKEARLKAKEQAQAQKKLEAEARKQRALAEKQNRLAQKQQLIQKRQQEAEQKRTALLELKEKKRLDAEARKAHAAEEAQKQTEQKRNAALELKEKKQADAEARQAQAAQEAQKQVEQKRQAVLEEQKRSQQPSTLAVASTEKQKIETKPVSLAESRDDAVEVALNRASKMKQKEDSEKISRIESLWQQGVQLYNQGRYTDARRYLLNVTKLEGNPRTKYTPMAKVYLENIKDRLRDKEQQELTGQISDIEQDMVSEVLRQQAIPYVEPPMRIEKVEKSYMVEPPEIRKKLRKNISLDFDQVDLKSVMDFLAQETGVNFVVSKQVIDLNLKAVVRFNDSPVEEVIKYLTKSLGLIYRIDKDVVWVAHPEEVANETPETRVYYLNKGGGLFTEFTPMSAGSSDTSLGGSSAQISKITTIEDTLKDIVPWPPDSKLTFDKRINALLVRNTPQNLQMLEDILYSIDVTPIQVLIEARFLEVDVTNTKEFGTEWKLSADAATQTKNGSFAQGFLKNGGIDYSAFINAAQGLNFAYAGVLTNPQYQAVLHALDETKKIKTLSSPRITTLNNQLATIKVVDEWIYPTRYEYEIVQFDLNGDGDFGEPGETTFKNVPKDFLRRDVGILLKVIPSVGADKKTINLSLIPEVSEATPDAFSYTGDVSLPKFTSRNLSTTVVVNSGDTVVLGGLIKESRTKDTLKVPVLGDIPVVGWFFKKNSDVIERKNLLIFVTAKVLSPGGEEVIAVTK